MNQRKKAVFNWSGGKDSALALQTILQDNQFDVVSLLTTINEETLTSSIHSILLKYCQNKLTALVFRFTPPNKISYDIRLDNGQTKTFEYWQADITA